MKLIRKLEEKGTYHQIIDNFENIPLSQLSFVEFEIYMKSVIKMRQFSSIENLLIKFEEYSYVEYSKLRDIYFVLKAMILVKNFSMVDKYVSLYDLNGKQSNQLIDHMTNYAINLHIAFIKRNFQLVIDTFKQVKLEEMMQLRRNDFELYNELIHVYTQSLRFLGNTEAAEYIAHSHLQLLSDRENIFDIAVMMSLLGNIYIDEGKWEKALKCQKKALHLRKEIGVVSMLSINYSNIGTIYGELGKQRKAMKFFNKAYEIDKKFGSKQDLSITCNNIGNTSRILGEIEIAREYLTKSLELERELDQPEGIAYELKNLARIDLIVGELENAVSKLKEAIIIETDLSLSIDLSMSKTLLGRVYSLKGEAKLAKDQFYQSLAIATEHGTVNDISEPLMYLAILAVRHQNTISSSEFDNIVARMSEIIPQLNNDYVMQRMNFVEAIKKQKKEEIDIACDIYKSIVNGPIIDHELTMFSAFTLCEISLNNNDVLKERDLQEIRQYLDIIDKVAQKQKSYRNTIIVYILKTKIDQIEGNNQSIVSYLETALQIAKQKGISYLQSIVEYEIENFLEYSTNDHLLMHHDEPTIKDYVTSILDETLIALVTRQNYHILDADGNSLCLGEDIHTSKKYSRCNRCHKIKLESLIIDLITIFLKNWTCYYCYRKLTQVEVDNILGNHIENSISCVELSFLGINTSLLTNEIKFRCDPLCYNPDEFSVDPSEIIELFS